MTPIMTVCTNAPGVFRLNCLGESVRCELSYVDLPRRICALRYRSTQVLWLLEMSGEWRCPISVLGLRQLATNRELVLTQPG